MGAVDPRTYLRTRRMGAADPRTKVRFIFPFFDIIASSDPHQTSFIQHFNNFRIIKTEIVKNKTSDPLL
jgi:hypothetical protein